jgi:hypothetical protein
MIDWSSLHYIPFTFGVVSLISRGAILYTHHLVFGISVKVFPCLMTSLHRS